MWSYMCGVSISILYKYLVLPNNEGEQPKWKPTLYPVIYKGMVIVPISSKKAIHIHHWIFYLFVLCISPVVYIHPIFLGFSTGLTFQGLTYNDRFKLVCDNPYNNTNDYIHVNNK